MNWTDRRDRLRTIVAGKRCVFPASVYDGISARIAEELGFEAMMLGGSVASFAVLAGPDNCAMTLTEFASLAYRINRAGTLPLVVDADHGYGNALNVRRTVEELDHSGVSALTIEDTVLPTRFRSGARPELISIEEGVGKMRAAVAGRQDPRLTVIARTSAVTLISVAEGIARLRAYEATGVDMLCLPDVQTREQLDAVASAIRLPLMLGGVTDEMRDPEYLAARNARICLQSHQPFWAAAKGYYDALKALRAGVRPKDLQNVPSPDLQRHLLREEDHKAWQNDFLN